LGLLLQTTVTDPGEISGQDSGEVPREVPREVPGQDSGEVPREVPGQDVHPEACDPTAQPATYIQRNEQRHCVLLVSDRVISVFILVVLFVAIDSFSFFHVVHIFKFKRFPQVYLSIPSEIGEA